MALTLEDIAKLSGVSRSTVSRVVNGDPKVSVETRLRVMDIIQKHDFHPNLAARRLAAGRTNVIGLVIPAGVSAIFSDPYFAHLIQGVSTACNASDYSVMLWLAEPDYERRMIRKIVSNGLVDGVVVASTIMNDPIVISLHDSSMPFILIGRHPDLPINCLDVDNVQGARLATAHLLSCGHTRIATITGPQNMIPSQDRFYGYRLALQEHGLLFEDTLVAEGDFTENGGYLAMKKLLPAQPQAVFSASDTMASGALRAIREAGLQVPDDISLVGYDDLPIAAQLAPPLTTIRQPVLYMATLAVETLIDIIHNPGQATRHIVLQPELILRDSCGPNKHK